MTHRRVRTQTCAIMQQKAIVCNGARSGKLQAICRARLMTLGHNKNGTSRVRCRFYWWPIGESELKRARLCYRIRQFTRRTLWQFLASSDLQSSTRDMYRQQKSRHRFAIPAFLLVTHRRVELRTPWLKVMCSAIWANGSSVAIRESSFSLPKYYIIFVLVCQ